MKSENLPMPVSVRDLANEVYKDNISVTDINSSSTAWLLIQAILNEYDEDEEQELVKVGPGEYVVEGSMKLDDLNDQLELELESEDYDSIGGLIIGQLDRLPEEGESVVCDGIRLVVDRLDKNRIDRVHMYLPNEQNVDA